jgi:hypothetical protein
MIKNIIFFYIIFYSFNSFAQENSKFKNEKWVMEYLLKYVIEQPSDTQYIEIRESNLRIKTKYCDYQKIILSDTLDSENIYFIEIASKKFELNKHHITLDSGIVIQEYYPKKAKRFGIGKIDGFDVYGTDIDLPNTEIGVFNIKINEKKIDIPTHVIGGLYEPNFCSDDKSFHYIEAYESKDEKKLYIYMAGSDAGGGYMVKWIFNQHRFIKRFITIYESGGFEFLDGQVPINSDN